MVQLPRYLKKGDIIGLMCPAGYMDAERTTACISQLKKWGFNVYVGQTVGGNSSNYFSGSDEERLDELQLLLDDKKVKAILFARGGYGTSRIIDKLNFKKFNKNPKWLIGFSDLTVMHTHVLRNYNIGSIHGPMAAAFNPENRDEASLASLYSVLTGNSSTYSALPNKLNRAGRKKGILIGGNLAMLAHVIGTASDFDTKNRILFIEDTGEYLYNIDRLMLQLKRSGKFKKLKGMVFGGFTDLKDTTRPYGATVFEILHAAVQEYDFPVCFDFPCSHGKENVALKIGASYELNVSEEGTTLTPLQK